MHCEKSTLARNETFDLEDFVFLTALDSMMFGTLDGTSSPLLARIGAGHSYLSTTTPHTLM